MFIPTIKEDLIKLGWHSLDIILITGDVYIDSYYDGTALIGHLLINEGYKVGIISQPDINSDKDIARLGEPKLFWGISSGCVDSMISNYTANRKRRNNDDLTPGGINNKRPDRALIVYTNLIRRYFKNTVPIILGGIEASLRRIPHYDYWSNKIRRSILFDAKADYLIYGMAEKAVIKLAEAIKNKINFFKIKGLCYKSKVIPENYIELPNFETVLKNKNDFIKMFNLFYEHNNPYNEKGLYQKHDNRYLIHNPPQKPLTQEELDKIYSLNFERNIHPYYQNMGKVKALNTIQFSVTTHRGCYGECNFCSITVHQGKTVISRSEKSIIIEIKKITKHPDFKGIISDLGGPTANMYHIECGKKLSEGPCKNKRCLYPDSCKTLVINHKKQIDLLKKVKNIKGIKKIFIASGIRYDMITYDEEQGVNYLKNLLEHHTSGQLKIAPEHSDKKILQIMGKPSNSILEKFLKLFNKINNKLKKKKFLTYYFIAAHPGCNNKEMNSLKNFIKTRLKLKPEQVQIFTPSPSTYSTLMYYTEKNPFTGESMFVEKDRGKRDIQKKIITG